MRRSFLLALLLAAPAAFAQLLYTDPDWKEIEVPPPPALRTSGLVELDMPGSSLRFGVDPASIAVGSDGIVRFVVVAQSNTGAVNAFYEGVRCNSSVVKVYARHNPDSGWSKVAEAEWQPLHEARNRHALVIARNGVCLGHAPNGTAEQIVRDLKAPVNRRFDTLSRP